MSILLQSYKSDTQYVEFAPTDMSDDGPHVSIIIGANGAGKSRSVAGLVSEFELIDGMRSQSDLGKRLQSPIGTAELRLIIDGNLVRFERQSSELSCFVNDERVPLRDCPFPRRIIAVAHLPVDRFRFSRNDDGLSAYRYLGLRQATNLTTTGALESRIVLALAAGQARIDFHEQVTEWLQLVGLDNEISVTFDEVPANLMDADHPDEFARLAEETYVRRVGYPRRAGQDFYSRFSEDLDRAWLCFLALKQVALVEKKSSARYRITLRFYDKPIQSGLSFLLESARRLRLLPSAQIEFRRSGQVLLFGDLSSGEQQIIGTMIRLLAELEDHSIVVIDEPEVSLHPSWQMTYVPTLQRMLRRRRSTHVVLATHSHFLVSDAHPNQATVVVPDTEVSGRFVVFDGATYGRSPENILYRVFGIGAAGNLYVERELSRALIIVSGEHKDHKGELRRIYHRLQKISSPDEAALAAILTSIKQFIEQKGL